MHYTVCQLNRTAGNSPINRSPLADKAAMLTTVIHNHTFGIKQKTSYRQKSTILRHIYDCSVFLKECHDSL